jgi:predicted TIM-barrel fold metal-dependent hydrolase
MKADLVSADSHVVETPDVWAPLESSTGGPHVRAIDGKHWWFIGDVQVSTFNGIQTGVRFEDQALLKTAGNLSEVRVGSYDPVAHLADNGTDGVVGSVLYPTAGLVFYRIPDAELLDGVCEVYNDWIAAFCAVDAGRLKGMAMLNVDVPARAASELKRAGGMGLAGGLVPVMPGAGRAYSDPDMDVLWEVASNMKLPIGMHIGTERVSLEYGPSRQVRIGATLPNADYWFRRSIGEMILSGVFDRYPDLYVVSAEHEAGWLPFFLERLDYHYTQKVQRVYDDCRGSIRSGREEGDRHREAHVGIGLPTYGVVLSAISGDPQRNPGGTFFE